MSRYALVGNPNCGKTSLFNRLTGANAKVANYPGVTVERRSGFIQGLASPVELIDLPGTYSLATSSLDEQVAKDMILGLIPGEAPPDLLIAVVDATNLQLGLGLVFELLALRRPMLVVLNQMDAARARGMVIDIQGLAQDLGLPVVASVAVRRDGIEELLKALEPAWAISYCTAEGLPDYSVEVVHSHIQQLLSKHIHQPAHTPAWQNRLDTYVMHPVWGLIILLTILLVVFQAVFAWAEPFKDVIEWGVDNLKTLTEEYLPKGILRDFLSEGIIAGVGGVLVFLPQIIILFFFILVLEDSGYLARAAFLLDKPMRGIGLSGRAFIPLLSSFACAVPGIMATRTIGDPKERWISIMVAPLMTCSARLPVYTLIIAAFIPASSFLGIFNLQGITLFALYLAGVTSGALIAWLLRQRKHSQSFPLLLELPNYRWPMPFHLWMGLRERATIFLRRVGTIILALTVLVWFLCTYPSAPDGATGSAIEYSFAGVIGQFIQPIFAPLGFNWQMCIALIPAMAAREIAVSTLATVYAVSIETGVTGLGDNLAASWSIPVALAYLAWFIYAPQCVSTIAVVRRETNSLKSTGFFVVYLFALAYGAALITYHLARQFI
ncbi:MAG TPA: ferrous iron transporter B [Cellvibrionaceae bacterium]